MLRSPLSATLPSADQLVGAAKEVGYVAVGFGVLGFQRLQVRRRELERSAAPALRLAGAAVDAIRTVTAAALPCTRADRAGATSPQA
jgi:hypothetical protein